MKHLHLSSSSKLVWAGLCLFLLLGMLASPLSLLASQDSNGDGGQTQLLTGLISGPGDIDVYQLPDLQAGDILTVHARTTSGNLDPLAALMSGQQDVERVMRDYDQSVQRLVDANANVAVGLNALRDEYFLVWDDDSGEGYAATFTFEIPDDGTYLLLVGAALGSLNRDTFGQYELLVGLNAPGLAAGTALPGGEPFVFFDDAALGRDKAVQEISGTLTAEQPSVTFTFERIPSRSTVYAFVEATSPGLRPQIFLRDFGDKPLAAGNLAGTTDTASLEHEVPDGGENYVLEVRAAPGADGLPTGGDFRLVTGINEPLVLIGDAEPIGRAVLEAPIPVQVGVRLNRLAQVTSKDENFTILGSMRMNWTDPNYAFSPDTCNCNVKVFTDEDLRNFLVEVGSRWPEFAYFNQVGPRWPGSRAAAIWSDGRATYVENFTGTFQADFDFRKFPFDTQTFPVYLDMLFSTSNYELEILPDYSAISSDHGEDEFIISDFETFVTTESGVTGSDVSRFTFQFVAPRHLDYYIFQIFVPILLIALISWFTFFLRDYTRRIEAAAGNVLLFIAFSFSLSDNYPRLGFLTFLDAIMLVTFLINTAVILYNVYLKQLESRGRAERAEEIDSYLDWAYPVGYLLMILVVVWIFFWRG